MADQDSIENKQGQGVEQYHKILENLHEGFILVDEEANICDANPAYCKMIGYTKAELLSMKLTEVRPEMSTEYQKKFIKDVIEEGSIEFETQHRRKDGAMIDLNASAAAIKKDGKIYLAGLVRDVTEEKEKQRLLEESQQQFKSLFEHNPHPVYYFDLEGNFKKVNERLVEFTGHSKQELLNMGFAHFVDESDLEQT